MNLPSSCTAILPHLFPGPFLSPRYGVPPGQRDMVRWHSTLFRRTNILFKEPPRITVPVDYMCWASLTTLTRDYPALRLFCLGPVAIPLKMFSHICRIIGSSRPRKGPGRSMQEPAAEGDPGCYHTRPRGFEKIT